MYLFLGLMLFFYFGILIIDMAKERGILTFPPGELEIFIPLGMLAAAFVCFVLMCFYGVFIECKSYKTE